MNRIKFMTDSRKLLSFLFLFAALLAFSSGTAFAQQEDDFEDWTTVGSAGFNEDESNAAFYTVDRARLSVEAGQPAGNTLYRYNVTATDGLFQAGFFTRLEVRYRDPGAGSRVFVVLRGVNLATGVDTALATFDSDAFAANAADQTNTLTVPRIDFQFDLNAYYLEVTFVRVATTDSAAFVAARIGVVP